MTLRESNFLPSPWKTLLWWWWDGTKILQKGLGESGQYSYFMGKFKEVFNETYYPDAKIDRREREFTKQGKDPGQHFKKTFTDFHERATRTILLIFSFYEYNHITCTQQGLVNAVQSLLDR